MFSFFVRQKIHIKVPLKEKSMISHLEYSELVKIMLEKQYQIIVKYTKE